MSPLFVALLIAFASVHGHAGENKDEATKWGAAGYTLGAIFVASAKTELGESADRLSVATKELRRVEGTKSVGELEAEAREIRRQAGELSYGDPKKSAEARLHYEDIQSRAKAIETRARLPETWTDNEKRFFLFRAQNRYDLELATFQGKLKKAHPLQLGATGRALKFVKHGVTIYCLYNAVTSTYEVFTADARPMNASHIVRHARPAQGEAVLGGQNDDGGIHE